MAIDCFAHKLSAVTWNSVAHAQPTSFNVQESIGWTESYAGGRVVPKRALDSVGCIASVSFQGLRTPSTKGVGTIADFVATMTDNAATPATVTVTVSDMIPHETGISGGNGPAEETCSYIYAPSSASDVAIIAVSS